MLVWSLIKNEKMINDISCQIVSSSACTAVMVFVILLVMLLSIMRIEQLPSQVQSS